MSTTDPFAGIVGELSEPLFLEVGKRYRIENISSAQYPFALDSFGSNPTRLTLCAQGPTVGSAESLASIQWHEAGNFVYFTYSEELASLLTASGRQARYTPFGTTADGVIERRGATRTSFVWTGDQTPQLETFEGGPVDQFIFNARGDWFVSSTATYFGYLARISNLPAGAPGQAPGSSRWLRIEDTTQPDNLLNSVVHMPVTAPLGTQQIGYTWEFRLNVAQTLNGARVQLGPEHLNTANGSFVRAWGLTATDTGLDLELNPTAISSGAAIGPGIAPLCSYTQFGFGKNQWLRVVLNAQIESAGPDNLTALTATVYPSSGGAPVTQTIEWVGEAFTPTIADGTFRFAIDNTKPVDKSTICIDNLSLQTSGVTPSSAPDWELYR